MMNTTLVIFKKGALKNIKKYSGLDTGNSFDSDFIEKQYELTQLYRIPYYWHERLEYQGQMDYGSWLYSCDRKTLLDLFRMAGIDHVPIIEGYEKNEETGEYTDIVKQIPVSEIPVRKKYGLFEMEIY